MLKFENLTDAQKRFVVAAIEANPSYIQNPQITLKECSILYEEIRLQRTGAKGEKIGYPNWLFANNKIDRGVYHLPIPSECEISEVKCEPVEQSTEVSCVDLGDDDNDENIGGSRLFKVIEESEVYDEDVEEFNQILRDFGIEV